MVQKTEKGKQTSFSPKKTKIFSASTRTERYLLATTLKTNNDLGVQFASAVLNDDNDGIKLVWAPVQTNKYYEILLIENTEVLFS